MEKQYFDMGIADWRACRVLGYTAGTTWLRSPAKLIYVVPGLTPLDIRRCFEEDINMTIRVEVLG